MKSLLLVTCACCFQMTLAYAASEKSALSGQVVDAGGNPLDGATVLVVPLSSESSSSVCVTSDKEGKFSVPLLPDGMYSVEASRPGFLHLRYYPVVINFPNETVLDFPLPVGEITEGGIQLEAMVSGTLEDKGKPASGSRICLDKIGSSLAEICTDTNELGQYAVSVRPGIYVVEVMRDRKQALKRKIDLSKPGMYRNVLRLK
jgi:Carboxypeptidase regulatory-like domain